MNLVEQLEEILSLDQAEELADLDLRPAEVHQSTQQLLDDMLGRFEEDDLSQCLTHGPTPGFYLDSDA